eukprot:jgi/Phyca11/100616/e_gw1.5.1218.1
MFWLLNILFSDRFFHDFLSSGGQLSKSELDQRGSAFWHGIATAFSLSDIEFDRTISDDSVFEDMDPSHTMTHPAAKLQRMWREVSSNFARVEAGSKKSGEHGEDFWGFCGGRADVFYLHKWCEHRGAGREFCAFNLYSDDEDDSKKKEQTAQKQIGSAATAHRRICCSHWLKVSAQLQLMRVVKLKSAHGRNKRYSFATKGLPISWDCCTQYWMY